MNIAPFKVESWMNEYETRARYNIAETCIDSISLDEFFALTDIDKAAFLAQLTASRLTYGDIFGKPALLKGIAGLYATLGEGEILTTHGAAGANHLALFSLVNPADHVISVLPTYQQLYALPEAFLAEVSLLRLLPEHHYQVSPEQVRALLRPNTKLICLNNPNNPTGSLIDEATLRAIVALAEEVGAYVLCDEVYRGLEQDESITPSIVDLYAKGISTSSMSKVFSVAGIRLGWVASHDSAFMDLCREHRDYTMISAGLLDEQIAALILAHKEPLLARNHRITRENLEILTQWVKATPTVTMVKPKAGTTALLNLEGVTDTTQFCRDLLSATGVFLTPGACFEMDGCVRIGFAGNQAELVSGLEQLSLYLAHR